MGEDRDIDLDRERDCIRALVAMVSTWGPGSNGLRFPPGARFFNRLLVHGAGRHEHQPNHGHELRHLLRRRLPVCPAPVEESEIIKVAQSLNFE
jgi:hypothetical protein